MSRSIDSPECHHGHPAFHPESCPLCVQEAQAAAAMLAEDNLEDVCFLGSDCLCAEAHGRPGYNCVHRRASHEKEKSPALAS